ncbi:von Willebrand factor type A [Polymorphum gilvum SL003B-26A1]|uniref:von Willebrand factor type A n=1 Tax=Polymorphum gilvum (strain LMG 25793 / CGMCC 1.9160 / SL003B-26A1) TaxID=991905 RepID=F2J040_POLGS|nr:von Willebrand factor type A [Polymorphum gilvum SL003B-26A1]
MKIFRFLSDRRGNIAIAFGSFAFLLTAGSGVGIDMSRVVTEKSRLQSAADATALAANYKSGTYTAEQIRQHAEAYFDGLYTAPERGSVSRNVTVGDGTISVEAGVTMPTFFAPLLGVEEISFAVMAESKVGTASFDVVLVLDNSGSMAGSRMTTLKQAASDLIRTLMSINEISTEDDRVMVGLVPFTAFVNIGADKATQPWMDREGRSPVHWTNFQTGSDGTPVPSLFSSSALVNGRPSRFSLYQQLGGTDWLGCVEARPMPYDVTDDAADPDVPASLYVPAFAPDEPDSSPDNRDGYRYSNNWLADNAGACSLTAKQAAQVNIYDQGDSPIHGSLATREVAQGRLCKYRNQPKSYGTSSSQGPNFLCKTQPITDLTNDKQALLDAVAAMRADGYTNIHQGVVWGWRVLTPQEPFSRGRSPDQKREKDHRRIMIVMTDGANTYQDKSSSHNRTEYNAYGYGTEQRLGSGIDTAGEIAAKMDERTALACRNAATYEATQVYTIAFQVGDYATRKLLRDCASSPEMAFDAGSNSELVTAFERIGKEISRLRLAR